MEERVFDAVSEGNLTTLKSLVAKGAKVKSYRGLLSNLGGKPTEALEIAKYLVSKGIDVNDADEGLFGVPIYAAIIRGDEFVEIVRFFIAKGAKLKEPTKNGTTLLHLAVGMGAQKIVKILIDNHLDVNARGTYIDPFANQRNMPEALLADFEKEVQETIGHMMEPGYRYSGVTPLLELRNRWNPSVAKILIDAGADLKTTDDNGWGIMHYAAVSPTTDMAKFFLDKGLDINVSTTQGNRPLHLATRLIHGMVSEEMVEFLLARGADRTAQNKKGQTPIASLQETSNWILIKQLGSTEPDATEEVSYLFKSFKKAAKLLDPTGPALTMPKLPTNENGTRYEPAMFTMLRVERWVRAEKDRVILTLRFSPLGQDGLTISFDDVELEGFETTSNLPRIVDLDAEQPTFVQFQFPAEAKTGARLNTKFRLIAGGMEDISSEYSDIETLVPVLTGVPAKKSGVASVFSGMPERTMLFRIDEIRIDGKVVPNVKGKEYRVEPGKKVAIKEAKIRLKHPLKIKYSYRYLPNKKWQSDEDEF